MGEIIPLFPGTHPGATSGPWQGGERSILDDFIARVAQRMPWGIDVSTGVAEDGDPWIALCDVRTGEVLLHIARVGGRYMLLEPEGGQMAAGADLRDLLRRYQVAAGAQASTGWGSWPLPVSAAVSLLGLTLDIAEAGQALDGRLDPLAAHDAGAMARPVMSAEAPLDLVVPGADEAPPQPAHAAVLPLLTPNWVSPREAIALGDVDQGWTVRWAAPGASDLDPRMRMETVAGPTAPMAAPSPQTGAGETLLGGPADETLTGGAGDDSLAGGAGDDSLSGQDGADTLEGGAGDDRLAGGAGADSLAGEAGDDSLSGQDGADTLEGGAGDDSLAGGSGDDSLSGSDALDGESDGFSLHGDGAWGGAAPEEGSSPGVGATALPSRSGPVDDRRAGGTSDDSLFYGTGADTLAGGAGDDTLRGGRGPDQLFGGVGADSLIGGQGDDGLWGGRGRDSLWGGRGDDTLRGGGGADSLDGGEGDDRLNGGAGRDTLAGGRGDDTLVFAAGDEVSGGEGADHFVLLLPAHAETWLVPRILDFSLAEDRLFIRIVPDRGEAMPEGGQGPMIHAAVLLDLTGEADLLGVGPAPPPWWMEEWALTLQGQAGAQVDLVLDPSGLLTVALRPPDWA